MSDFLKFSLLLLLLGFGGMMKSERPSTGNYTFAQAQEVVKLSFVDH